MGHQVLIRPGLDLMKKDSHREIVRPFEDSAVVACIFPDKEGHRFDN
jgi:hypothetical protein